MTRDGSADLCADCGHMSVWHFPDRGRCVGLSCSCKKFRESGGSISELRPSQLADLAEKLGVRTPEPPPLNKSGGSDDTDDTPPPDVHPDSAAGKARAWEAANLPRVNKSGGSDVRYVCNCWRNGKMPGEHFDGCPEAGR